MDARNIGLRNIEVADTRICAIDGENGESFIGVMIFWILVSHSTFEETCFLLLFGDLPTKSELLQFTSRLRETRTLNDGIYKNLKNRPPTASPMDILQSSAVDLADYDPDIQDDTKETNVQRAIMLISTIPTIVDAWNRIRQGLEPLEPLE